MSRKSDRLSVVTMTWNRSGPRLRNLLSSLLVFQRPRPEEFIVVDTSTDPESLAQSKEIVAQFRMARLIHFVQDTFNKCQALNVGIRASTRPYVACADVDFIFGPGFINAALPWLKNGHFVVAEGRRLPAELDLETLLDDGIEPLIGRFMESSGSFGRHWRGKGCFQAMHRDWWFKVHGYDERYEFLGGMDGDMLRRARHDRSIDVTVLRFQDVQAWHQYHPPSPMKGHQKILPFAGVVRNPVSWGQPLQKVEEFTP